MSEDRDSGTIRRIALAGATGTIGRAVARTLRADGHSVLPLLRKGTGSTDDSGQPVDYGDGAGLAALLAREGVETVISCMASRSGAPRDAQAVDFRANLAALKAAEAAGAQHFILLSAICVQKPLLAFQHAKLAFERALQASAIDHTIVRPTAFFKSLSGQVERVRQGKPFLVFGDGELTRCKPISDHDLARFIADCVVMPERRGAVLPIGGPGPAISLREQGEMLFSAVGRPARFRSVPVGLFSAVAGTLSLGARVSQWCAEKAEYARIARYYATESMLVLDPRTGEYSAQATPEFGEETLADHYAQLAAQPAAPG